MANPTHVANGTWVDQTTGATLTLPPPAGLVDGHCMLAFIYHPDGTAANLAGWDEVITVDNPNNGASTTILGRRASSDSGSYAFVVPTGISDGFIASFAGCKTTGNFWTGTPIATPFANDGGAAGSASGSLTPAVNEALMVYWLHALDDITSAYAGGGLSWTERINTKDVADTFSSTHMATAPQATAGAVDASCTIATGSFRTAHLIALAPAAGGGNAARAMHQNRQRRAA